MKVHNRRKNKLVLWLRVQDIGEKLDIKNICDAIDK